MSSWGNEMSVYAVRKSTSLYGSFQKSEAYIKPQIVCFLEENTRKKDPQFIEAAI